MNNGDRNKLQSFAQLRRMWHEQSQALKQKRWFHLGVRSILLCTAAALVYATGAWHGLGPFLATGRQAPAPRTTMVSSTVPTAGQTIRAAAPRTEVLEDGTTVTLAAGTVLEVAYSPEERKLWVLEGAAVFHVTKERTRPFIVLADDLQARALGTRFRVQLAPMLRVDVYDGVVAVSESHAAPDMMGRTLRAGEFYEQPPSKARMER